VSLWEEAFSRENLAVALRRVEQNASAPGIDGMRTDELRPWLRRHWSRVRVQLDAGTYRPSPVRRVKIPKLTGGVRELGGADGPGSPDPAGPVAGVTPSFDLGFSEWSFGFRPGRSAHQAVERVRRDVADGFEWAVSLDSIVSSIASSTTR
jgi:RNA-directed DNA polymerase